MQYMIMIHASENDWNAMPAKAQEAAMAQYSAYGQALAKANAMAGGARLKDVSEAVTVRVTDGKTKVLNGPYVETKEQFGGYYLIEAKDMDEAIQWAAKCPGAHHGSVEVRPVWPTDNM